MYVCFVCNREIGTEPTCKCGADLRALQAIIAQGNRAFNRALESASEGHSALALEYLAVDAALLPGDVEAQSLRAQLLAEGGRGEEARLIAERLYAIDPGHPAVVRLAQSLEEKYSGDSH